MYNPEKALDRYESKMPFKQIEYLLKQPDHRIDMNDPAFKEVYSEQEIQKDLETIKEIEKDFDNVENIRSKDKQLQAQALELILSEDAHALGWFGNDEIESEGQRTSKYDDYVNGVDCVFEFQKEEEDIERILIGVDFSENAKPEVIKKKIENNYKKIKNPRKPAQVKYFKSNLEDGKAGRIRDVVPLVVGLNGKNVNKIITKIADLRFAGEKGNVGELKEMRGELEKHPFQVTLLKEMQTQLDYYKEKLEDEKETDYIKRYKEKINSTKEIIDNLLESKQDIIREHDGYEQEMYDILNEGKSSFITEEE